MIVGINKSRFSEFIFPSMNQLNRKPLRKSVSIADPRMPAFQFQDKSSIDSVAKNPQYACGLWLHTRSKYAWIVSLSSWGFWRFLKARKGRNLKAKDPMNRGMPRHTNPLISVNPGNSHGYTASFPTGHFRQGRPPKIVVKRPVPPTTALEIGRVPSAESTRASRVETPEKPYKID